ncbi:WYL domain-containing protein [Vibrio sp. WJH972]
MKISDQDYFNYIESIVWWEGQINATHLMRYFYLSRDTASTILREYDHKLPENLIYDSSAKARVITDRFNAITDVGNFDYYLKLIMQTTGKSITENVEEVEAPFRNINAKSVRPILKAIREKLAIDIGYISLTSPDYLDRIIEPHTLIFDGLRWHVRAYCRKNTEFRDFVLSRFNGIAEFEGPALVDKEKDLLWNTFTDIEIIPDPGLTQEQQKIIANDFQMKNNKKIIKTRAALVNYLLLRLRLDQYKDSPEEQQIVLTPKCRKSITPFLPKPT